MPSGNVVCSGVFFTFIAVISIIGLAMLIVSGNDMSDSSYQFIVELGKIWAQGPVTNIYTSTSSTCPNSFVTDVWPGTVPGCKCIGISRGYCNRSKNSVERYCLDVNPVPPVAYRFWEGSILCKETTADNYLDLNVVIGNCPSGTKKCGIADNLENSFCVTSTATCPINDVQFVDRYYAAPAGYSSVGLGSGKKIIFSNSQTVTGKLPMFTKVQENQPCSDAGEINSPHTNMYILDRFYGNSQCITQVAGSNLDNSYKLIDSYSYYDLLSLNGVLTAVSVLPGYPIPSTSQQIGLFLKPYVGLKPECKAKLLNIIGNDTKDYIKNLGIVGDIAVDSVATAGTGFALAIVTFIFCVAYVVVGFVTRCCIPEFHGNCRLAACTFSWLILAAVFSIVTMAFGALLKDKISKTGNAHVLLDGCLDNASNQLLKTFINATDSVKVKSTVGAIFFAANFVCIIIEIIIFYCCRMGGYDSNYGGGSDDEYYNNNNVVVVNNDYNLELADRQNAYAQGYGGYGVSIGGGVGVGVGTPNLNADYNNVDVNVRVEVQDKSEIKSESDIFSDKKDSITPYGPKGSMGDFQTPEDYDANNQEQPPPVSSQIEPISGNLGSGYGYNANNAGSSQGQSPEIQGQVNAGASTNSYGYGASANVDFNANAEFNAKQVNADADAIGAQQQQPEYLPSKTNLEEYDANKDYPSFEDSREIKPQREAEGSGNANYGFNANVNANTDLNANADIAGNPAGINLNVNANFGYGFGNI